MDKQEIKKVTGQAVYVPGDDIDTDRIIPARFMRCITFDDLGQYTFYDVRFNADGTEKNHPLNVIDMEKVNILISGNNFGCGSSREHAPQALLHFGFKAFIAESFAEIFAGNCTVLGLPAVSMNKEHIKELAGYLKGNAETQVNISLEEMNINAGSLSFDCKMPEVYRNALVNGTWNSLLELRKNTDKIKSLRECLPYLSF